MKFKHEIEIINVEKNFELASEIKPTIATREKTGWEHYDTIINPTSKNDIYLFFKKPIAQRAKVDTPKTLQELKKNRMKIVN